MDAAGSPDWQRAVSAHEQFMGEHHQQLVELTAQVNRLSQAAPVVTQSCAPFPPMQMLKKYEGDTMWYKDFLFQCSRILPAMKGCLRHGR